jgi:HEAT repeat protein
VKKFFPLTIFFFAAIFPAAVSWAGAAPSNSEDSGDALVDMVIELLSDKDKDALAIGLQQVREEVKGAAATRRFAVLLPKLPPDARSDLIDALGARADKTARNAVVEMLKDPEAQVRAAAVRALGLLGEAADVPLMARALDARADAEKTAALGSLEQIRAEGVDEKIALELKATKDSGRQTALIQIIQRRKSSVAVPALLDAALSDKPDIRSAALQALGQLAAPDDIPKMVELLLKTKSGAERENAERAVMLITSRIKNADDRAGPLLAAWRRLDDGQKTLLLPTLGRVGGENTLKIVEQAIADSDAPRRDAGVRALCNWPDASAAPRLLELAQTANNANYRALAMQALSRVAVLRDNRTDAEKLALLKKIMAMADNDEQRNYVLERAKAVRTIENLRFVLSHMDKPELAQRACATVVDLAHYRELRDPNKEEFDKALDRVIAICKDSTLVDYAKRYKRGETVDIRANRSR